MIRNFFCLFYGVYMITPMLFSCAFDDANKINLIKNVLHEKMYKKYDSFIKIKDEAIGEMLKQLLDSRYGFALFQKLSALSNDHVCIIKINRPLGKIAGLQKRVQKEDQKNVWTLNCSFDSMERIIAVKKMQDVFAFYKIKVPPYIILAHELLHYLFRLENYEKGINEDKFIDKTFLKTLKGKILHSNTILLFGDIEGADAKAYDELITIVGHKYNINGSSVFLGESVFLQEYLETGNCFLSYGHESNINDALLTLENIYEIINLEEVAEEIAIEDATQDDIDKICKKGEGNFLKTVGMVENKLDSESKDKSLLDGSKTPSRIGTPPNQNIIDSELITAGYQIQDVPGDGNCAFWAILVAKGKISQEELDKLMSVWDKIKREKGYCPNWSECDKTISAEIPEAVEKMVNLRKNCGLGNLGSWTGDENFQQISEAIQRPIVLVQMAEGSLTYNLYDENTCGTILEEQNIKDHNNPIFIYYADNHFQAIVPNS